MATWHCKTTGAYSYDSVEAQDNVLAMVDILVGEYGWTKNAVAGLAGNQFAESGFNPWRWQSDSVQPTTASPWTDIGYGLFQFTPAGKYINNASSYSGYGPNFSNQAGLITDGEAQLRYINDNADYYATTAYPLSFEEFKQSTESGGYLALAWLYNYERPADPSATASQRESQGNYWLEYIGGYTPSGGKKWLYGGVRDMLRRLIIHA